MSKETNLHTPDGDIIFERWYTFKLTKNAILAAISSAQIFKSGGIVCGAAHENEVIINKKDSIFNFEMPEIKPQIRPSLDLGFYPVLKTCEINPCEKFSFGIPRIIKP